MISKRWRFILAGVILLIAPEWAGAEVVPGDLITKSNSQKIEGLVPDFVLKWVREGDLTMKIGELDYDPAEFLKPEFKAKTNTGKYKVVENNCIKDSESNQLNPHPHDVKGFPFPEPDLKDPTLPIQILHNFNYAEFASMPFHENQFWFSIGRRGVEKKYEMEMYKTIFSKGSKYDYGEVSRFRKPFDIAGTGSLGNFFIDPMKNGLRYAYAPMLRKVKRLSHRLPGSETNFDLDNGSDDNWAGGPRTDIEKGRYQFLREQVALVPYIDQAPAKAVINEKGEIETGFSKTGNKISLTYEFPDQTGAPWHIAGLIWVKRKVYVFESRSINPNYRYGPCEGWVEQQTFTDVYKRVTDISGHLWKGMYRARWVIQSENDQFRDLYKCCQVIIDMKRDHGSAFLESNREGGFRTIGMKDINLELFSRAGFVRFTR